MRIVYHSAAEEELDRTVAYYEGCAPGLGMQFLREVAAATERIVQFPEAWPPLSKRTRRCLLSRFPHGVVYQVVGDAIRVIAVADLRRRPGYWLDRR